MKVVLLSLDEWLNQGQKDALAIRQGRMVLHHYQLTCRAAQSRSDQGGSSCNFSTPQPSPPSTSAAVPGSDNFRCRCAGRVIFCFAASFTSLYSSYLPPSS